MSSAIFVLTARCLQLLGGVEVVLKEEQDYGADDVSLMKGNHLKIVGRKPCPYIMNCTFYADIHIIPWIGHSANICRCALFVFDRLTDNAGLEDGLRMVGPTNPIFVEREDKLSVLFHSSRLKKTVDGKKLEVFAKETLGVIGHAQSVDDGTDSYVELVLSPDWDNWHGNDLMMTLAASVYDLVLERESGLRFDEVRFDRK